MCQNKFGIISVLIFLGMTDRKIAINLIKRSKIILFLSGLYIHGVTFGCFIIAVMTFAFNLSLWDFILFGILWSILWPVWTYTCGSLAFWSAAYYYIVCYYLKIRLNSIQNKLRDLLSKSRTSKIRSKCSTIKQILEEHNDLCRKIDNYNKFWRKYLTITLLIFISLVCFLSYLVFFPPMKWSLRLEFSVVLMGHTFLIIVLTYSASTISHFNYTLFRDLNSVNVKFNFSPNMKIRASLKH